MSDLGALTASARAQADRTRADLPTLRGSQQQQAASDLRAAGERRRAFGASALTTTNGLQRVGPLAGGTWPARTSACCFNCEEKHDNTPLPLITGRDVYGRFVTFGSYCSVGCALADARTRFGGASSVVHGRVTSFSRVVWRLYFRIDERAIATATASPDPKRSLAKYASDGVGLSIDEYRRGWLFADVPNALIDAPLQTYGVVLSAAGGPTIACTNPVTGDELLDDAGITAARVPNITTRKRPADVPLAVPGTVVRVDSTPQLSVLKRATQRARDMTADERARLPPQTQRVLASDADKKYGEPAILSVLSLDS
jgi:hypothetical protein